MNTQNIWNHSRLWFQQSCVEHEEVKQTRTLVRTGKRDDRDPVSQQHKWTEHSKNEGFSSLWGPVSQILKYVPTTPDHHHSIHTKVGTLSRTKSIGL